MMNDYTLYLADAIELCNSWEIPEPEFADAANAQARLMAGMGLRPSLDSPLDDPYQPLQF